MNYLSDPDFQRILLGLICRDHAFLKAFSHLLQEGDFKPSTKDPEAKNRWIIATKALAHYGKYREPIGHLLLPELRTHAKDTKLGLLRTQSLLDQGKAILRQKLTGIEAVSEKVLEFKTNSIIANAIEEMVTLHSAGELSNIRFLELARQAMDTVEGKKQSLQDFFDTLPDRIDRRLLGGDQDLRFPVCFIDPLDSMVRLIARGHLGLIMAPYKRGKSLLLIWLAIALLIQRMNVLHITLEDPRDDVEDRYDAAIANLPIRTLGTKAGTLRKRFRLFQRIVKGRLRIYDGTDETMTVRDIEALWEQERENGFIADALIIDYDDEIKAAKKHQERRFEFAEIYRDLRRLASKRNILIWTAAQTRRDTNEKKILSGDELAEDISKARKVACAISVGKGDWGDDSLHLYVAAHKYDRQHIGCDIYSNKDNMLIYDRVRTLMKLKAMARQGRKKVSS